MESKLEHLSGNGIGGAGMLLPDFEAGIVHDLRNLLTPILPAVFQLRARTEDPQALLLLEKIEGSASQAAALLQDLQPCEPHPLVLGEFLAGFRQLLKPLLPSNIEVLVQLPHQLPEALADARLLRRVLLNLCMNARDAMAEGGQLQISAEPLKDRLLLSVSDTGSGMPEEVAKRAFDPFYSTKAHGAGQGLSIVKQLMEKQGGSVALQSHKDHGTVVSLFLPMADTP